MSQLATTMIPAPAARKLKNRVSIGQTIHDTLLMAYRGLLKFWHTPEQFVDVTLQPIIFTLMFTYIFGGAIAGDIKSYLPIIIPGILVQTTLTGSVVTGTQIREEMDKGVLDRIRSLPISRISPLAGALIADIVRYVIAITITFVMGYILGYRPAHGVIGMVEGGLLLVACTWSLSWIFALLGVLVRSVAAVQGPSLLVLFPLTFVSNALVPTNTMPAALQWFANVNPVSHLVTAIRDFASTGAFTADAGWALLGSAIIVLIFAPLTVSFYMRKA